MNYLFNRSHYLLEHIQTTFILFAFCIFPLTNNINKCSYRILSPTQLINKFIHSSFHPSIHLPIHPSIHPSIHSFIYSSIHPSIHPSMHPCMHACIHSSIHPSLDAAHSEGSAEMVVCCRGSVISEGRPFLFKSPPTLPHTPTQAWDKLSGERAMDTSDVFGLFVLTFY